MKIKTKARSKWILLSVVAAATVAIAAENFVPSGFMADYSQLERPDDSISEYRYVAEGVVERVAQYDAVMIDQPEIFIAADSPYGGAKPKHLEALAESLRAGIISALSEDYDIVEKPGANVMYIRPALTNLRLTKKKKRIVGYTPIGLVGGAVVGAATSDLAKKANLQDVVIEGEVYDSMTEERLVALIDKRGEGEEAPASWEELEDAMLRYGMLLHCRLGNARVAEEDRTDCATVFD